MKKRLLLLLVFAALFFLLVLPKAVAAEETEEEGQAEELEIPDADQILSLEEEYDSIQEVLDEVSGKGSFSFSSYVKELMKGDASFSFRSLGKMLLSGIREEFLQEKKNLSFLLAAGVAGGMMSALAGIFTSPQARDTGFYLLYLLLFSVLSVTFMELVSLAGQVFSMLLKFMKVLLPAYFLAIAFCTGARTSYVFYETMLLIITIVELVMIRVILPAVKVYFVLGMVDQIAAKPFLTRFLALIEKGVKQGIRIVFLVVLSLQGIEAMLAPFVDSAAKSVVLKAVGAIPGLGTGAAFVADALLKSGMLLKNAIGLAGALGILFVCAYPVGKMLFYTMFYYLCSAVTEAVSESRLLSCIECSAHAAGMLLYAVCAGVLLFLLTIGITLAATNV